MALHSKEITRTTALRKEVIRIACHSKETSRHTALSKMEEAIPHSRIMHKVYRMLEVLGGMIMQTVQVTVDHLVASKVKHLGTQGIQLVKVKVTATPKSAGTSRKGREEVSGLVALHHLDLMANHQHLDLMANHHHLDLMANHHHLDLMASHHHLDLMANHHHLETMARDLHQHILEVAEFLV
jgi:hypothetical protein